MPITKLPIILMTGSWTHNHQTWPNNLIQIVSQKHLERIWTYLKRRDLRSQLLKLSAKNKLKLISSTQCWPNTSQTLMTWWSKFLIQLTIQSFSWQFLTILHMCSALQRAQILCSFSEYLMPKMTTSNLSNTCKNLESRVTQILSSKLKRLLDTKTNVLSLILTTVSSFFGF